MREIKRDVYLKKLIDRRENGSIKVITGMRRCGKSYLLFELYYRYLIASGVDPSHIIRIALDDEEFEDLLDPKSLSAYIRERVADGGAYYIFLDEIQLVDGFERTLNGLNRRPELDVYVTGSNSKFLSSDILTEFRGRGDEVRIRPLSFAEFMGAYGGSTADGWKEYTTFGGMPLTLARGTDELKSAYLTDLFRKVYMTDIVERHSVRRPDVMETIVNILASTIGSLTNPLKLARTFESRGIKGVSDKTISSYIGHLEDAFIIERAMRYDVKGKQYIATPQKYYFADVGLRNAMLNFRQQEENHIMENIIYSELRARGFSVDVGSVSTFETADGARTHKQREIDFVCGKGSQRYYIQSAFAISDDDKMKQETASLTQVRDSFKKIVVVRDDIKPWRNDDGILFIGVLDMLLNEDSLDM